MCEDHLEWISMKLQLNAFLSISTNIKANEDVKFPANSKIHIYIYRQNKYDQFISIDNATDYGMNMK